MKKTVITLALAAALALSAVPAMAGCPFADRGPAPDCPRMGGEPVSGVPDGPMDDTAMKPSGPDREAMRALFVESKVLDAMIASGASPEAVREQAGKVAALMGKAGKGHRMGKRMENRPGDKPGCGGCHENGRMSRDACPFPRGR